MVVGLGESGADIVREISEVQHAALMLEGVETADSRQIFFKMKICLNVVKRYICPIYRSWCRFEIYEVFA